jgi:hypothetical protein
MFIKFECVCGQRIEVNGMPGQTFKCPSCNVDLSVPKERIHVDLPVVEIEAEPTPIIRIDMTYQEKVKRVVDKLSAGPQLYGGISRTGGYDTAEEWAESILRAVGITEKFPNGNPSMAEIGSVKA